MTGRNGQTMLGTYVPDELAAKFKAQARISHGGASALLRDLVTRAFEGQPAPAPAGGAAGFQVMVRLKEAERLALVKAAHAWGTTPANWLRSLAIVHLGRRPQWSPAEVEALRELFTELLVLRLHSRHRAARSPRSGLSPTALRVESGSPHPLLEMVASNAHSNRSGNANEI